MDIQNHYHLSEDEIEALNMNNMVEIIKAIAIRIKGIVSGKETSARMKKVK